MIQQIVKEELHKNNTSLIQPTKLHTLLVKEEHAQMMLLKLLTVLHIKLVKEPLMITSIIPKDINLKNLMVVSLQLVIWIFNVDLLKKELSQNHIK